MRHRDKPRDIITRYYQNHLQELIAYIRKGTKNDADSEDTAQDIFLRLLEMERMITPATLPSLVYTMARNMVTDYWRHRAAVCVHEHYIKGSAADNAKTQSVLSAFEITDILERGMAKLPAKQRQAYRLNVLYEMKVSEIAEYTGEKYKSVEGRLGAARKVMRKYVTRKLA